VAAETRRTGGGANADFFASAGCVYIVGGGAFFAAVDPRKERNIAPVDDTSTSPNFYGEREEGERESVATHRNPTSTPHIVSIDNDDDRNTEHE
jgi:hypothetical protein